jgi:glucokinase
MMPAALVADIGGTNARLALVEGGRRLRALRMLRCADHAGLPAMLDAYCTEIGDRPRHAALAVPSMADRDLVAPVNLPWRFSIAAIKRRYGFGRLIVVNDFAANALAVPQLRRRDRVSIGPRRRAAPDAPVVVVGPGSGLGVCALVPDGSGRMRPVVGEGGHATMAPATRREAQVLDWLRAQPGLLGHVSAERVLSGPGLVNLYRALCALDGVSPILAEAAAIADARDAQSVKAVRMFCAMLGTVAGNLALTFAARGGVYIAGGIVPRLGVAALEAAGFRERFEAKGRFNRYVAAIPTSLITHPVPALLGLAGLLTTPASDGAARTSGRAARGSTPRSAR